MRLFFSYLILLGSVIKLYATPQDTLVYVKGYYFISYPENEILLVKMNEELEKQGRNFSVPLDIHKGEYFYSTNINGVGLLKDEQIASIYNASKIIGNYEIYKFPPYRPQKKLYYIIQNFLYDTSESEIANELEPLLSQHSNYFKMEGDSTVNQIYYIEGWALRTVINTDYLDLNNELDLYFLGLYPPVPNLSIPSFFMYLFYKIDIVDARCPPPGFLSWEPKFDAEDLDNLENSIMRKIRKDRK